MTYRRLSNKNVQIISTIAASTGLLFLIWILSTVLVKGIAAFNWSFFVDIPTPPGIEGGGIANAIVGTFLMTLLATVMAIPVGLLAGVYLAEFGKEGKFASAIRFTTNVLIGVPSIIVGIFVYALIVIPMNKFSGYAGAFALGVIMFPVVVRATEDMLQMVPDSLRESSLALGIPRWRTTLGIVFREARNGLLTGILLAVARVSGETAPLLFTALNSSYWVKSLSGPTPNMTVTIFNYAMSPYSDWQSKAWGASLLITGGVLFITIIARFYLAKK